MGTDKNIELHIVTDIKATIPQWANIQQNQKIQPSHAKHVALISEFTSKTPGKQLKLSRKCTSGKPTGTLKTLLLKNRSFHSDDSMVVLVAKPKQKLMDVHKEDGRSSQLSSCCNF